MVSPARADRGSVPAAPAFGILSPGEVSEWLKVPLSKSGVRKHRGFESHPLRHAARTRSAGHRAEMPAERSPRGLGRRTGNAVWGNPSRVRIPPSPPPFEHELGRQPVGWFALGEGLQPRGQGFYCRDLARTVLRQSCQPLPYARRAAGQPAWEPGDELSRPGRTMARHRPRPGSGRPGRLGR